MNHNQDSDHDKTHADQTEGDHTQTGDVEGVGIAIGRGANVRIYGDVHYHPIQLRAPLHENFNQLIADYTELFAGRNDALTTIGDFIQNPTGGYLVVTAPAGFGKTALIANLVSRTPDAFAYHFFTATYVTDGLSESFFLRNVVEQMAEWHDHDELLPTTLQGLSALYHQFLDKPLDRTQILVIDGLDEVTWDLKRYLARRLPANLHVILTVRDVGQDWMTQYGLPADQTRHLPMDGLTRDGVAQVLRAAGGPASTFAGDSALLDKIMCISAYGADETLGADPFYVRLLAEDAAAGRLTPENVAGRPQGLDSYLDEWWQQIKDQAGEEPIRSLFGTLTVVLGPISRQELEAINPSLQDDWTRDYFDEVLHDVRRWVVGDDERGYALAHPRLRGYMRTCIKTDPYQDKLLDYCAAWPEHHSPYALRHYAQHLAEAGQTGALYALIDKPWMDAKLQHTGSHRSFADDVNLAIEAANAEEPPNLVQVARGCLIYATLGSLATNAPPKALGVLAQVGETAKALGYAALIHDAIKRSEAYRLIGEAVVTQAKPQRARQLLGRALATAEAIEHQKAKDKALCEVAQALAQVGEFDQALAAVESVEDRWHKWYSVHKLVKILTRAGEKKGLRRTLGIAQGIEDQWTRVRALTEVAMALARVGDKDGIGQVLAAVKEIQDDRARVEALKGVTEAQAQIPIYVLVNAGKWDRALAKAMSVWNQRRSAKALSGVALALASKGEFDIAFEAAEAIGSEGANEGRRASALRGVALILAEAKGRDGLDKALATAKVAGDDGRRAKVLNKVAHAWDRAEDRDRLTRALSRAKLVKKPDQRAEAFGRVAQMLVRAGEKGRAAETAEMALAVVEAIGNKRSKSVALCLMAQALAQVDERSRATDIADAALKVARSISMDEDRVWTLPWVAQGFAKGGEYDWALAVAETIKGKDKRSKVQALIWVAEALIEVGEKNRVAAVIELALSAAEAIGYAGYRAEALLRVAGVAAQAGELSRAAEIVGRAHSAARVSGNEWQTASALALEVRIMAKSGEKNRVIAMARRELASAEAIEFDPRVLVVHKVLNRDGPIALKLGGVAEALARVGELDMALETVEAIGGLQADRFCGSQHRAFALSGIVRALATVGDKETASEIAEQVFFFMRAEWWDEEDKAIVLKRAAQALAQLGDKKGLRRARLVATRLIAFEWTVAKALVWVAQALAQVEDRDELNQVLAAAEAIEDEHVKMVTISRVAQALVHVGLLEETNQVLLAVLAAARLKGRGRVFLMLGDAAATIAAIDQGQTLWQVYRAVMEVEGWWGQ